MSSKKIHLTDEETIKAYKELRDILINDNYCTDILDTFYDNNLNRLSFVLQLGDIVEVHFDDGEVLEGCILTGGMSDYVMESPLLSNKLVVFQLDKCKKVIITKRDQRICDLSSMCWDDEYITEMVSENTDNHIC